MRKTTWLMLFFILAFVVQAMYYYPLMPEPMASHFGTGGKANDWMPKAGFFVLMAGVQVLFLLIFLGIPKLVGVLPNSVINMPHKDYWLAPERRQKSLDLMGDWLGWFGVAMLAFFLLVGQLTYTANLREDQRLDETKMWTMLVLFLAFTVVWLVLFYRAFKKPPEADRAI